MSTLRLPPAQEALQQFRENHPEMNSIQQIVSIPEDEFVKLYGKKLAGGDREARQIHRTAANLQESAALLWVNIKDAVSPYLKQTLFNNLPENLPEAFINQQESIPGYNRLFGNLDFIECDHYRSIFGPAAYFVDLMRFVEQNITQKNPIPSWCSLEERRPDLARIRLDAINTSDLIPYIDLVNELLEAFVKTGGGADRDTYEVVKDEIFPMSLPFDLPLAEIRSYLKQLKTSLHQIYQTFEPSLGQNETIIKHLITREFLELSPKEFSVIISEISQPADLSQRYGVVDASLPGNAGLENVEVFLAQTGLTRKQLNELIFQDLDRHEVNAGLSRLLFINNVNDGLGYLTIAPNTPDPEYPNLLFDKLLNLSSQKLDRIYRFLRLSRKLGWSFAELDWALRSLRSPYVAETALRFDGINDYVACRNVSQVTGKEFTVEAWINPSRAGSHVILSKGSQADQQLHFMVWINAFNQLSFYGRTPANPFEMASLYTIPSDAFTHIAVMVAEKTVRFYINGRPDQGATLTTPLEVVGEDLNIGRDLTAKFFAGVLKEVRIWKVARTPNQIANDRYGRLADETENLIGYWPLIETVDHSLTDLSGSGNHGKLGGEGFAAQPQWVRRDLVLDSPQQLQSQASVYFPQDYTSQPVEAMRPLPSPPILTRETVLHLDGDNDVLVIQNAKNWGLGRLDRWTLELWFNATDRKKLANRQQVLFTQGDKEAGLSIYLFKDRLYVLQWCNNFEQTEFRSSLLLTQKNPKFTYDHWHHLAVTHNEFPATDPPLPLDVIEVRAFLDGTPLTTADQTTEVAPGFRLSPVGAVCLGGLAEGMITGFDDGPTKPGTEDQHFFAGQITELRLWRTVKSAEELRRDRIVAPMITPDLLAYLPLDEGTGWLVRDRAGAQHGNPFTGTLQQRQIALQTTHTDTELVNIYSHYDKPEALAWKDYFYAGRLRIANKNDAVGVTFLSRHPDGTGTDQYYRLSRDADHPTFHLVAHPAGVQALKSADPASDKTVSTIQPKANVWHHFLIRVKDTGTRTTIQAKIWPAGKEEPADFQIEAYDDNPDIRITSGTVGVWTVGNNTDSRRQFDNLCVWPTTSTNPNPADLWLDINFEAQSQMPEPEHWRDTGDRIIPLGKERLFRELKITGSPGRAAFGTDSTLNNIHAHYHRPEVDAFAWQDYTYEGQMRITEANSGIGVTVLGRDPEAIDQYYSLRRDAEHRTFHLAAHPDGVQPVRSLNPQTDQTDSGIDPAPNTWYRFSLQVMSKQTVNRTEIRGKVWEVGTPEPPAFQMMAYDDSSIRLQSGTVGVWATGPGSKYFDQLRVIQKLLLSESFQTYAPDQDPLNWRNTGKDNSREEDKTLFKTAQIDTTIAFRTVSTDTNIHSHYVAPGVLDWGNYIYTGRLYVTNPNAGIGVTFLSRYADDTVEPGKHDHYYRLRRYSTKKPATFHISPHRGDGKTSDELIKGKADSGINPKSNTWYRFHIEVEDTGTRTNIRAKVWQDSEPEPADFQIDAYDDAKDRLKTGTVGLWALGQGAKYFDDLQVFQPLLLSSKVNPEHWSDTPSRDRHELNDTLFKAIDIQDNQLQWTTIDAFPLLRRPLAQTALEFNGNGQYLAGELESERVLTELSVEAWVKPSGTRPNPILSIGEIANGNTALTAFGLNEDGHLTLTTDGTALAGSTEINTTEFTHVAVRVQAASVTFLVNGVADAPPLKLTTPFKLKMTGLEIGRNGGSQILQYFAGQIKEVRLWNMARTNEQIAAGRYQRPEASDALMGYWQLGGKTGNQIRVGSPQQPTLKPGMPAAPPAPIGVNLPDTGFWSAQRKILTFNGSQSVHYADPGDPHERQQRTIEVWFQVRNKTISHRKQVIYHEGDGQRDLLLYVYDSELYFVGYNMPTDESRWETTHEENWWVNPVDLQRVWRLKTDRIESGRWHHAAIVLDGRDEVRPESLRGYLDGKLAVMGPGSKLWQHKTTFSLSRAQSTVQFHDGEGQGVDSSGLSGGILQVRLWNRARTAQEIADNWSQDLDLTLPPPDLDLLWNLDEASGIQIPDKSGKKRLGSFEETEQLQFLRQSLQDLPVSALTPVTLDETALHQIADIKRLKDEHHLSIDRLTALWSTLKHVGREDSSTLFDQVFNTQGDKTERWDYHLDRPIRWDRTGQESRNRDRQTRSKLMASLQVSSQDLDALVKHLSGAEISIELDTPYLTRLYRLARLPKLLRLPVMEFLELLKTMNQTSIETLSDVLRLRDRVAWMQRTGISVAELIFFGKAVTTEHAELFSETDLRTLAKQLGEQAKDILVSGESFATTEISQAQSMTIFQFLQDHALVEVINSAELVKATELVKLTAMQKQIQALAAVKPGPALSDLSGLTEYLATTENWMGEFDTLKTELDFLRKGLGDQVREALMAQNLLADNGLVHRQQPDSFSDEKLLKLLPAPDQKKPAILKKRARIREWLEQRLDRQERQEQIQGTVHETLTRLRAALSEALSQGLTDMFEESGDLVNVVIDYLDGQENAVDAVAFIKEIYTIQAADSPIPGNLSIYLAKFVKLLYLLAKFELSVKEAKAFLKKPEMVFTWATTPLALTDLLQPSLDNLDRLAQFQQLKTAFNDEDGQLIGVLGLGAIDLSELSANDENVRQLTALTGWEPPQLITLAKSLGGKNHNQVEVLHRLQQCFALAQSMGSDVDFLIQLSSTQHLDFAFYSRQAAILLKVLRANYSAEEWAKVYKPIRNQLAVQKRDALLALAMKKLDAHHYEGRKDPDILYEYFLLDMQMGSEVETSRIVQATASLQLYVQRCLMNLEAGVNPATIPLKEWEWVKNYRVWEANRKVFLYPENYIEPELRRTKTPLFKELEQNLLQADINQEAVEKAYISYLDQFAELAKLKIVGSYLHRELEGDPNSGDETLYLIGRTDTQPRMYYLRKHMKTGQGERWLPWEKIDVAINSDFATPVYAFGKLLLFWTEFSKLKESQDLRLSDPYLLSFPVDYLLERSLKEPGLYSAKKLEKELSTEQITKLKGPGPDWTIDSEYYLFDNRIVGRVQKNVDVYKTVVKYSYYNFGKTWISPQTHLETQLSEEERKQIKWQKLYVQRAFKFNLPSTTVEPEPIPEPIPDPNQKFLQIDENTKLFLTLPPFDMKQLTWSFWVKFVKEEKEVKYKGSIAKDPKEPLKERTPISQENINDPAFRETHNLDAQAQLLTLLNYDNGSFQMTATNYYTAIPGAQIRENDVSTAVNLTEKALKLSQENKFREAAKELAKIPKTPIAEIPTDAIGKIASAIKAQEDAIASRTEAMTARNEATNARAAAEAADADKKKLLEATATQKENQAAKKEAEATQKEQDVSTRQRDAVAAIQAAHTASTNQLRIEVEEPKWESKTLKLSVRFGDANEELTTTAAWNVWRHVAVTLEKTVDGYQVKLIQHGQDGAEVVEKTTHLKSKQLAQGELLEIGRQTVASEIFTTHMAEFRLWNQLKDTATIQEELFLRKAEEDGLFSLPLNSQVPESHMTLVESEELTFTIPIAFQGALSEHLSERERIIIFYGDTIKSIRNNLLEEQGFKLELKQPTSKNYDVGLRSHQPTNAPREANLSLMTTDGLFVNDFATLDHSAILKSTNTGRLIIQKLQSQEVSFLDVHNRPGWYILDTGDEQFLIKAIFLDKKNKELPVLTAAELMQVRYDNAKNTSNIKAQNISVSFDLQETQAPVVSAVNKVEFQFERLSTYAIHQLSQNLFTGGIDKFLSPASQRAKELDFWQIYRPDPDLVPEERNQIPAVIDFQGSYRLYYEEMFFHIPFLIANQLNANQQFADAQKWYHYIFNPTIATPNDSPPNPNDRYWQYLPYRNRTSKSLQAVLTQEESLTVYREDPFDPHAIAALRLTSYQKSIVMKYIDNLLDWGDSLFTQDTRESINEATMLYILAFNLLGPRPKAKTVKRMDAIGTYNDFVQDRNAAIEFLTDVEKIPVPTDSDDAIGRSPHSQLITHFCVPENEKFIGYWDQVEDRLYKIRHSLNIEGIFRQLALFQPPINPAALVQAVAGGGGIAGALADLSVAVPHYRYAQVLQQAKEVTSMVSDFGSALLSALEAKEEGQLTLLQHIHERNLLNLMTTVKEYELSEAKEEIEALNITRQNIEGRQERYRALVEDGTAGLSLNAAEGFAMTSKNIVKALKVGKGITDVLAKMVKVTPDIQLGASGFGGSPLATTTLTGDNLAAVLEAQGAIVDVVADGLDIAAEMSQDIGAYQRRLAEWKQEGKTAEFDLQAIEKQMAIAGIRLQRMEFEQTIHEKELQQKQEVADFFRIKFTNGELRNWMVGRLSGLYFQAYKLAYDLAKGAEKALQFELPSTQTFITPGHWDSLKKGLLAGESLTLELNRMDKVRLDQDSRFQEIEKTISMKRTFPEAFGVLKQTGGCELSLSERLFNLDFPGHYCRLIKTMAISVKTAGEIDAFDGVHASLSQTSNRTLLVPDSNAVSYLMGISDDPQDTSTLRVNWRTNQQIAISKPSEDLGMFNLNFFLDDRYFPFEGTGAVSTWRFDMPLENNPSLVKDGKPPQLRITDVIIHLRYTSKVDQGTFKQAVQDLL